MSGAAERVTDWPMPERAEPVEDDSAAASSMNRTLHPEVVLLGDHTMSCIRWTLDLEIQRLDDLLANTPTIWATMEANGWTTRALALGHIIAGLVDLADFDDEKERT